MQSAKVTQISFFPAGAFQKAFFLFGLFAAAYFSYERAIELTHPVTFNHSQKKLKTKHTSASFFSSQSAIAPVNGKMNSYPLVAAPVAPPTSLDPNAPAVAAPGAEVAAASASAIVPAVDPENPDAQAAEDLNAPLIHSGVAYSGPAPSDFFNSHSENLVPAKPAEDPAAFREIAIDKFTPKPVTSSGSTSYSPGAVSTASTTPVSNLTAQDYALLTSRPFTTLLDESAVQGMGATCTHSGVCTPNMHITLSGSRWDTNHGIKNSGATLSAQSASAGIPIQFAFHFLVQPVSGADVPVDLALVPTEANASEQTVNGVSFKTFEFTFDDQVAASDHLNQVKLVLVYQKSAAQANYVLSTTAGNLSEFTFARSGFDTVSTPWVAGNQNQSSDFLKPDSQKFSFKIQ